MSRRHVIRTVAGALGGAALLAMLGAATCEGTAIISAGDYPPGECLVLVPDGTPPPAQRRDVIAVTDSNNVNDFIQCQVFSVGGVSPPDVLILVSLADEVGHAFVGGRGLVFNLSRSATAATAATAATETSEANP